MHFLNSSDYAPAAIDPGNPYFKEVIIDHARTLDLSGLSSLSGKFGFDIFRATTSPGPNNHKATLEAVKAEIDAMLEAKMAEEAESSLGRSPSKTDTDVEMPDVITTEAKTPEAKVPKVKTPEVKTSKVKTPKVLTSKVKTPDPKTSEMKTPDPKTPEEETPGPSRVAAIPFKLTPKRRGRPPKESPLRMATRRQSRLRNVENADSEGSQERAGSASAQSRPREFILNFDDPNT
ncbi:MAG: hypothetical protein M1822_005630 [Bathelium mastoideum]|nr:MAG: hypothetical protein M1822_005630 [Bathelium mastoideum]